MKSSDLKTVADILVEMRQRWPSGLNDANLANIRSFLAFRLKQIPDSELFLDRARLINFITKEA